jgi:hypothetical protein
MRCEFSAPRYLSFALQKLFTSGKGHFAGHTKIRRKTAKRGTAVPLQNAVNSLGDDKGVVGN